MADRETNVLYKALADFSALHAATLAAQKDLDSLKAKEAEVNAASAAGSAKSKVANDTNTKSVKDWIAAEDSATSSAKKHTGALSDDEQETKKISTETKNFGSALKAVGSALAQGVKDLFSHKSALDSNTTSQTKFRSSLSKTLADLKNSVPVLNNSGNAFSKFSEKVGGILGEKSALGGIPIGALIALITALISVINPLVAGLGALGGAAIGLAQNLGTLSGVLLALPGILGAVATGVGAVMIAFKSTTTALSAGFAAANGTGTSAAYQTALKGLAPAAQTFTKAIVSMNGAWKDFQKTISQSFFSQFVGQLKDLPVILKTLTPVFNEAATTMGKFFSGLITMISGPAWTSDFATFGKNNVTILQNLGGAFDDVLNIIRNIVIASSGFTQEVSGSLKNTADSLDRIVGDARNDGGLAAWLNTVYQNLQLWWGIVSNIGKTILNYAGATSSFGNWITTGFLKITQAWETASEGAGAKNSPFEKWLEDIKPLVSEIRSIVGDFFKWLASTAGNEKNIQTMISLLKDVGTSVGPAVAKLLDVLGTTKIGPDVVNALGALVNLVDSMLKNGGAQVIEDIYGALKDLLDVLNGIAQLPGGGSFLTTLVVAIGGLSAISTIGKFTGLTTLIGSLVGLSSKESSLLNIFKGLTGLGSVGGTAAGGLDGVLVGALANPLVIAAIAGAVVGVVAFNAQPKGTQKDEGKVVGDVGGVLTSPIGSKQSNTAGKKLGGDYTKVQEDMAINTTSFWTTIFKGLGFGTTTKKNSNSSAVSEKGTPLSPFEQPSTKTTTQDPSTKAWAGSIAKWSHGADQISTWWKGVIKSFQHGADQISTWWHGVTEAAGKIWPNISSKWTTAAGAAGKIWGGIQSSWKVASSDAAGIWADVKGAWKTASTDASVIWAAVKSAWATASTDAATIWADIKSAWKTASTDAANIWTDVKGFFKDAPGDIANAVGGKFSGVLKTIGGAVSGAFSGVGSWISAALKAAGLSKGGEVPKYLAAGGQAVTQYLANGSNATMFQPQGTDTIPAMLTPGEYVLRKSIVNAVGGPQILDLLNNGIISYQQMLTAGVTGAAKRKGTGTPSFLTGTGLAGSVAMAATPRPMFLSRGGEAGSGPANYNNGTTIQQLHIHNPIPERSATSLARSLRKVGYSSNRPSQR